LSIAGTCCEPWLPAASGQMALMNYSMHDHDNARRCTLSEAMTQPRYAAKPCVMSPYYLPS
jgi:hypothetical protein